MANKIVQLMDKDGNSLFPEIRQFLLQYIMTVGYIIQTTDEKFNPNTAIGGTWTKIGENRAIMGASSAHPGGTTAEAGLPNITGEIHSNTTYSGSPYSGDFSGAFKESEMKGTQYYLTGRSSGNGWKDIAFDASRSSSIYGNSTTVQPPAVYVYIWERIA